MKRISFVFAILLFSSLTHASLLVDPYVGTGLMKTTYDVNNLDDDDDNLTAMGARLGYQFILVSAGIDYSQGTGGDFKFSNTSFFVGVDLPILLRVWGEYFISSSLENDNSNFNNTDFEFKDGTSLGVGFTGLPFVSLNLELQNINYEADTALGDFDFTTAAYIFSVSLPLNF